MTTAAWLGKSVLNLICPTTPRSLVNWLSGIPPAPTIHYAKKHLEDIWKGCSCHLVDAIVAGAVVLLSLSASFVAQARALEISVEAAATSCRRRVTFKEGAEGGNDAIPPISDESVVDSSGHTGDPRVDTASAACSSGGGRAPELSSELFNSLQHADDSLMQQLGSFLSASVTETANL